MVIKGFDECVMVVIFSSCYWSFGFDYRVDIINCVMNILVSEGLRVLLFESIYLIYYDVLFLL